VWREELAVGEIEIRGRVVNLELAEAHRADLLQSCPRRERERGKSGGEDGWDKIRVST
jgi:hypothetical protein